MPETPTMSSPVILPARSNLSPAQRRALRAVAALIIPADAALGMPGADDVRILADIDASLGRDAPAVQQALARLDALAQGVFADAPAAQQNTAAASLREHEPALAAVLEAVTAQAYYRDDRVMQAIGMEVRAPFPKGFELEAGDLSLLDPVRARPKVYRDVP
jgi:hypothetical protein